LEGAYPDGGKTMQNNKGEKFTTSPYRLWALLSSGIILTSILAYGYDLGNGMAWQIALIDRAYAAMIAILLAFWLSWAVSLLSPIRINDKGIRSYTITGNYKLLRWEELQSIGKCSLPGFRYALITSTKGTTIWVPAWLINRENFVTIAKQHGSVGIALENVFEGSLNQNIATDAVECAPLLEDVACHQAQ
jgi:hypothetical protein